MRFFAMSELINDRWCGVRCLATASRRSSMQWAHKVCSCLDALLICLHSEFGSLPWSDDMTIELTKPVDTRPAAYWTVERCSSIASSRRILGTRRQYRFQAYMATLYDSDSVSCPHNAPIVNKNSLQDVGLTSRNSMMPHRGGQTYSEYETHYSRCSMRYVFLMLS